jgi:hypothetical protein
MKHAPTRAWIHGHFGSHRQAIHLSIHWCQMHGSHGPGGLQRRCLPTQSHAVDAKDGFRCLAKVRVAGSSPVVRSK